MKFFTRITGLFKEIKLKNILITLLGSAVLAYGLYNVHSFSGVTEGGVLGLTLLLHHWFGISPSVSGFIMNALCYLLGWKTLGSKFIVYSAISGTGFSLFYLIFEQFPPFYPDFASHPLLAAVVGALFVGVGVGLGVRVGAASGGDDALAMSISHISGWKLEWIYLASDLAVLLMSLSYIPLGRIMYSLLTVVISGQLIGIIQRLRLPRSRASG